MTLSEKVAEQLRVARARLGISQEELAFRAEIHRSQISLIEGGHRLPRLDTFVKLAGALEVEPGELLGPVRWRPGVHEAGAFVGEQLRP